jgi:hypothetical protein
MRQGVNEKYQEKVPSFRSERGKKKQGGKHFFPSLPEICTPQRALEAPGFSHFFCARCVTGKVQRRVSVPERQGEGISSSGRECKKTKNQICNASLLPRLAHGELSSALFRRAKAFPCPYSYVKCWNVFIPIRSRKVGTKMSPP